MSKIRNLVLVAILFLTLFPHAEAVDRCTAGLTCVDLTITYGIWGATSLNVTVQAEHDAVGGVTGRLYVDDVEVDSCTGGEACTTGPHALALVENTCATIRATSKPPVGGEMSDTQAVCATNWGFEIEDTTTGADCPPAGWDNYSSIGSACRSLDVARSGLASLKIDDPGNGHTGAESFRIPVSPSDELYLSGWFNVTTGTAYLFVEWYNSAGSLVRSDLLNSTSSSTWVKLANTKTAPANAASASLLAYSCVGCVTTAYVDDAFMEQI